MVSAKVDMAYYCSHSLRGSWRGGGLTFVQFTFVVAYCVVLLIATTWTPSWDWQTPHTNYKDLII